MLLTVSCPFRWKLWWNCQNCIRLMAEKTILPIQLSCLKTINVVISSRMKKHHPPQNLRYVWHWISAIFKKSRSFFGGLPFFVILQKTGYMYWTRLGFRLYLWQDIPNFKVLIIQKTTESSEESTLETKETELWKTWPSALCSHWLTIRNR